MLALLAVIVKGAEATDSVSVPVLEPHFESPL
jgi:hypothetical protein